MNDLLTEALEELDQIVVEEYGLKYSTKLYEARDDEDDGVVMTPFRRMGSFPARALRYRKAKNVMNKYINKIDRKSDKIIRRFIREIDKTIPSITKRGQALKSELEAAKKKGDKVLAKSIVNQQSKFLQDVKADNEARLGQLQNGFDALINTYTEAIHHRIDEPGYVLKVELSAKGKAELKALWEEKIAKLRQEFYGKTLEAINNKNINELEGLVSLLEVEVEEAEIESRRRGRRQRDLVGTGTTSTSTPDSDDEPDPITPKSGGPTSVFKELKKLLDEKLPEGLLDVDEPYKARDSKNRPYDVYIEVDDEAEKITAVYYDSDEDYEDGNPAKEDDIKDKHDINALVDEIERGEQADADERRDLELEGFEETLVNHLSTMFKTREKFLKDAFDSGFYLDYNNTGKLKKLAQYIVGEIADNPGAYPKQEKILKNQTISDRQMVNLFLRKFIKGFESLKESFISLEEYKKLHS